MLSARVSSGFRWVATAAAAVACMSFVTPAPAAGDSPFSLSVSNGKAKVGEAGSINVTMTAGEGFKANVEYPNKIKKLKVAGDADLAATTVPGAANGKTIVWSVAVTPKAAGTHSVTGEIRFSVCNDTACHIKKVPLDATITGT